MVNSMPTVIEQRQKPGKANLTQCNPCGDNDRMQFPNLSLLIIVVSIVFSGIGYQSHTHANDMPYQATGFKIGELTHHSAIIWTRLTRAEKPNSPDGPEVKIIYRKSDQNQGKRFRTVDSIQYPKGATVSRLRYAAPGMDGEVRVRYRPIMEDNWMQTPWRPVQPLRDFTRQFRLNDLASETEYEISVQSRNLHDHKAGSKYSGGFTTAPTTTSTSRISFTVSTGQRFTDKDLDEGFKIYASMQSLSPNFFVHTGDIIYYDELAKNPDLARYHWQRTYSLPTNVEFHRHVGSYFIKDDHDTWLNDSWPSMLSPYAHEFTFEQGKQIFREQVPMGKSTYRTIRWGKNLQIWLVEGRDFRSPNTLPDGPEKTIWGKEQKRWFKQTVRSSNAAFRILISPTPIVGPDRPNKKDNHSNSHFNSEGNEIREFIASQKNLVVICGDRHWQYMSIHPTTGVREYSCGPASEEHAGGWKKEDFFPEYHRYLNVTGGFLSGTIEQNKSLPTLTFRYHDVNGKVLFEDQLISK
jgi:alkaline phosphatase D